MATSSGRFVRIDVSKDRLDVAVLGDGGEWQVHTLARRGSCEAPRRELTSGLLFIKFYFCQQIPEGSRAMHRLDVLPGTGLGILIMEAIGTACRSRSKASPLKGSAG